MSEHENSGESTSINVPVYKPTQKEIIVAKIEIARNKIESVWFKLSRRHPTVKKIQTALYGKVKEQILEPEEKEAQLCYFELQKLLIQDRKLKQLPKTISFATEQHQYSQYRRFEGSQVQKLLVLDKGSPDGNLEVLRLMIEKKSLVPGSVIIYEVPHLNCKDKQFISELKELLLSQVGLFSDHEIKYLKGELNVQPESYEDSTRFFIHILSNFNEAIQYCENEKVKQKALKEVKEKLTSLTGNWSEVVKKEIIVTYIGEKKVYQEELSWFSGGMREQASYNGDYMKNKEEFVDISPTQNLQMLYSNSPNALPEILMPYYYKALHQAKVVVIFPGSGEGLRKTNKVSQTQLTPTSQFS